MGKFSFFSRAVKGKGRLRKLLIDLKAPLGSESSAALLAIGFKDKNENPDAPYYLGVNGNPQECLGLLVTLLVQMAKLYGMEPIALSDQITKALKEKPEAVDALRAATDEQAESKRE